MDNINSLYAVIQTGGEQENGSKHIYEHTILGEPIIDIVKNAVIGAGFTVVDNVHGVTGGHVLFIDASLPNVTAVDIKGLLAFHLDASEYTVVSSCSAYITAEKHTVYDKEPLYYKGGDAFETAKTLSDVLQAQNAIMRRVNSELLSEGVFIINPEMTYISPKARIGQGTVIYPNTFIEGNTIIGKNCRIGQNCRISNMTIGDNTDIDNSVLLDSTIGDHTHVGPFAYVRPNSVIGNHVKIGDFVEVKNTNIGNNTKASHLTYLGDSDIGNNINIGCGVVTSNYNGVKKARTCIKDGAFVGCNVNLIPPVTIEENAYIAAGSTINRDVPEGNLGIARQRQENKPNFKLR